MNANGRRVMFEGFWRNTLMSLLTDAEYLIGPSIICNIRFRGHNNTSISNVPEGGIQLWIALTNGMQPLDGVTETLLRGQHKLALMDIWRKVMSEFNGLVDQVIFNTPHSKVYRSAIIIKPVDGYVESEYLYIYNPDP